MEVHFIGQVVNYQIALFHYLEFDLKELKFALIFILN